MNRRQRLQSSACMLLVSATLSLMGVVTWQRPVYAAHLEDTPAPTTAATSAPPPTVAPTVMPTTAPTAVPTSAPTAIPTKEPTAVPTLAPTRPPITDLPTPKPTNTPAPIQDVPTAQPTRAPAPIQDVPTVVPTQAPAQNVTAIAPSATPRAFVPFNSPTPAPTKTLIPPTVTPAPTNTSAPAPAAPIAPTVAPSTTPTAPAPTKVATSSLNYAVVTQAPSKVKDVQYVSVVVFKPDPSRSGESNLPAVAPSVPISNVVIEIKLDPADKLIDMEVSSGEVEVTQQGILLRQPVLDPSKELQLNMALQSGDPSKLSVAVRDASGEAEHASADVTLPSTRVSSALSDTVDQIFIAATRRNNTTAGALFAASLVFALGAAFMALGGNRRSFI